MEATTQHANSYEKHTDAPALSDRPAANVLRGPVPKVVVLALLAAGVVAAYQRIGTRANADTVELTRNLAGGFLAVGMTADQPGFVVLSALDPSEVTVTADQYSSVVGGTRTVLQVASPATTWRKRLRKAVLVVVDEDGGVAFRSVDWTLDDVRAINEGVDCRHPAAGKVARCGAPFADLHDLLSRWPAQRVPDAARNFLSRYRRHAVTAAESPDPHPYHNP